MGQSAWLTNGHGRVRLRLAATAAAGSLLLVAAPAATLAASACDAPPSGYNVIIGTDESEVITGTSGADFICARLGDDTIRSLGGNDLASNGWAVGRDLTASIWPGKRAVFVDRTALSP